MPLLLSRKAIVGMVRNTLPATCLADLSRARLLRLTKKALVLKKSCVQKVLYTVISPDQSQLGMEKTMSNSTPTPAAYRLGLVGRKVGMTRIFTEEGESIPVTVLDVSNNRVTQVKSPEIDGYAAVQVAYGTRRASRVTKPQAGHYAKAGTEAGSILKEFRLDPAKAAEFSAGAVVAVESVFEAGQKVDVTGTTIGKGFAGTIKRHHFSSQRASHGNSRSHRVPGSIGQAQDPGRIFPGKKMSGHLGDDTRTVQNLDVVRVDAERGLLLVRGGVPGHKNANVIVRPAIKMSAKKGA
jgi:large subunit ribosomal protein L3